MFEAPQLDEVGKGLIEAANLIKKKGWWNGKISKKGNRTVCAALAIHRVFKGNLPMAVKAHERLRNYLGLKTTAYITAWNDSSNAETVIRSMKEAAYNQESTQ